MPLRARVQLSIDPSLNLLTLRYIGDLDGGELYTQAIDLLGRAEAPWSHDMIVDMTRFTGVITSADNEWLGRAWKDLAKNRDAGRLMAVISNDPLVFARKSLRAQIFPNFISDVFASRDEALTWIRNHRATPDTVCA